MSSTSPPPESRIQSNRYFSFFIERFTLKNIVIIFSVLLFLPKSFTESTSDGIDGSWQMSINMAFHQGLVFGKDWVFTYGPLGFLSTRRYLFVGDIPFLVLDIFCVGVLIYILNYAFNKLRDPLKYLCVPYFMALVAHNAEINFSLFAFFTFLLFHAHREKSSVSLTLAAIISILSFFVKLNLGLISSTIFYGFLAYQLFLDRTTFKRNISFFAGHIVIIFILCQILHVDVVNYIKGGLSVINNYNDAMFSNDMFRDQRRYAYFNSCLAAIIITATAIVILSNLAILWKSRFDKFIVLVMLLSLYLGFKQGFTRFGLAGMPYFFFYGAFFVGIAYLFIGNAILKKRIGILFGVFLFISPFASTGLGFSFNKITLPYQNIIFQTPMQRAAYEQKTRDQYKLEPYILSKFKNKTVDVFPFEISYACYNDLNYNPRPAIQSYQAYNDYLTTLNYNKYVSPTAPDYIIYEVGPASDAFRYGFWSDSKSTLAMLQNYDYDTTTVAKDTIQILKKRAAILPAKTSDLRNISVKMNQVISVSNKGELTWMKAKVNYSIWGKIRRTLAQPPILYVEATFEDGRKQKIKAIVSELESGVFLKDIQTRAQGDSFLKNRGQAASITKLQFLGSSLNFDQDISISLHQVSF